MRKATVKILKKPSGVPDAQVTVSHVEGHNNEHAVVFVISALDEIGIPYACARLAVSPQEAQRIIDAVQAVLARIPKGSDESLR